MKFEIYCQGHTDFDLEYNSNFYRKYIIGQQDIDDNIDCLHRLFCEYCSMYWVWKNTTHRDKDILAFCHYSKQINPKHINISELLKPRTYQLFYSVFYQVNIDPSLKYNLIQGCFRNKRVPQFVLDDIEEFLDTQEIIPQENILVYNNSSQVFLHNRNIYACSYKNFTRYMEFIQSYIDLVAKNHNIQTKTDWVYHIKEDIIEYYRDLNNQDLSFDVAFWADKDNFYQIYDNDYGLNSDCHVWRLYAYIIEFLFSIYMHNQYFFYDYSY